MLDAVACALVSRLALAQLENAVHPSLPAHFNSAIDKGGNCCDDQQQQNVERDGE